MAVVDMDSICFYQPTAAVVSRRGLDLSPCWARIPNEVSLDRLDGGHAKKQTDGESLPSLEELLSRNKDETGMKGNCQSRQDPMDALVTGCFDESALDMIATVTRVAAAGPYPFNGPEKPPSPNVEILVESERDEMSASTGHNECPVFLRAEGAADRGAPLLMLEPSSDTDWRAQSSSSLPEHSCCNDGGPEGSQTDIFDLESPSDDVLRTHLRGRLTHPDTVFDRSIRDQVDDSQRGMELQLDCVDDLPNDDRDLTGEDLTKDHDDQDYMGGMESESESEQSTVDNSRPQLRQRSNTFGQLLPPLSSISDEWSFSSVRSTRSRMDVQAHSSNQGHFAQVAASAASSIAGADLCTATNNASLSSMRLAIRGYLDIRYLGPVPHYSLLFEQDEECPPSRVTHHLGRKQNSAGSDRSHSARGSRKRFTPKEDRLLMKLKETKGLSWEQIAKSFPRRSPGTLQVHYCTKLKVRGLVPQNRQGKGREMQLSVPDSD